MIKDIKKIVIVGGGSAGWMSASTLINFFPDKEITVIESPNIPTVGVGESTLGQIRNWMHVLGIKEKDFITHVDGSYKLGNKFVDFYEIGDGGFHYPFGQPLLEENNPLGLNIWQAKKVLYPETPARDYCRTFYPNITFMEKNKYSDNKHGEFGNFRPEVHVAYHFDAVKFAIWLRDNYAMKRGVKHLKAEIKDVKVDSDGVSELVLDDGTSVTADLYVDCSGFKSMLLEGALGEPFIDYSHTLPNNRAWAVQIPYTDKDKELQPFTTSTALGNGWVWNTPSWSRIGTGYVYSDKYITPEDALQEFKNHLNSENMVVPNKNRVSEELKFRELTFKPGIHKRVWVKNVVAIGLSAGFIEPLEANGLFTVHEFLLKLQKTLHRGSVSQWDIDTFNYGANRLYNDFAEFVALHYALSIRNDTEYWREIGSKTFDQKVVDALPTLHDGFIRLADKKMFQQEHSLPGGIHCVATGMNYMLVDKAAVLSWELHYGVDVKKVVDDFIEQRKQLIASWRHNTNQAPTLNEYLRKKYYEDKV
jgi:tryptophan halogenase